MIQELSSVLSQMTQVVGDLAANADAMRSVRARHKGADLIVFPELQLIGYPPEDLVLKPALAERAAVLLAELAADTPDGGPYRKRGRYGTGGSLRGDHGRHPSITKKR